MATPSPAIEVETEAVVPFVESLPSVDDETAPPPKLRPKFSPSDFEGRVADMLHSLGAAMPAVRAGTVVLSDSEDEADAAGPAL
jgi:hypothetical protein